MDGVQLRAIRKQMGLTQAAMAGRLRLTENSVARMERDEVSITPSMELLIQYVAQDHEAVDSQRSRRRAGDKRIDGSQARPARGQARQRQGAAAVQKRGR